MGLKRKLLGVTTGAMLLCSMIGGSVLAAGHVTTGGNLQIEKYVVLDGGSIVPNQKFSFKIEPLDVQPNTKENNLEVKKGKELQGADAIQSGQFDKDTQTNDEGGKKVAKDTTAQFDFSGVQFEHNKPAIYRYKVSENAGQGTGMSYDNTKYQLDVYVDKDGNPTSLVAKKLNDQNQAEGEKVPLKFVNTYKTESLTVEKNVTGASGETEKAFEFHITVKENDSLKNGSAIQAKLHKAGTQTEDVQIVVGTEATFSLKSGEKLVVPELPKDTDYTLYETEHGQNGYTTTVTVNDQNKDNADTNREYKVVENTNKVVFTNNRDEITPTGILLNVAPYAAGVILAAFAAVLFLAKKRRNRRA